MINFRKDDKNKESDNLSDSTNMSAELEKSLKNKEITPTKDFMISLGKVVGVLVIVVLLFLGGRWLWQNNQDDNVKPIEEVTQEDDTDKSASEDVTTGTVNVPADETEDSDEETMGEVVISSADDVEIVKAGSINATTTLTLILSLIVVTATTLWHRLAHNFISNRRS